MYLYITTVFLRVNVFWGKREQSLFFFSARPTFLNLSFNLNLWQGSTSKSSPLSGMSPQPKKLVKPMSTLLEEQTNRDLHLIRGQELLEEASDDTEESSTTLERNSQEEIRSKLDLAELESNNRKISSRCLRNSDPNLKEKIGFTERNLKHSATQDSLTEFQVQAKTPSALSSGYGSQVLSTTPVSSEDSMSVRSLSAEDLTSSEPSKSMLRNFNAQNAQNEDKMDSVSCAESHPTQEKATPSETGISPAQLEELSKCCHISYLETLDQKTVKKTEENMWNVGRCSDLCYEQIRESQSDISEMLQTAVRYTSADVVGNINSKVYCDKEGTENVRQTTCIKEKTNDKCESFFLQKSDDEIGENKNIEKKTIGCENTILENTSVQQNVIETSAVVNNSADRRSSVRLRMKKSKQLNPAYRASYPGCSPSLNFDCQQDDSSGSGIPEENMSSFLGEDSSGLSSSISHSNLKDSSGIHIPSVGESVTISPHNKTGVVAFVGQTEFASGIWAGIVLDTPSGKNDGSLNGVEYFRCKPCFGIFVRPEKLTLYKGRRNTSISDRLVRSTSSDEGFLVGKFSSRRRSYDGNHPLSAKGYSLNSKRKYISEEPVTRTMMRSYSGTEGVGVSLTRKQICRSRYYKGNQ
ncbi:uncharacterized protein LOC143246643 isoform X2 [Tachypleus tridentatus]|uniref:uncharacterized protein LOC143246643 isoform X2 n=1 Tax=Tachypleus tridentatus TaxID=6853 RepID=UPI003FD63D7F